MCPHRENTLSFGIDKVLVVFSPAFIPFAPTLVIFRLGVGADPTLGDSNCSFLPQKSTMMILSISFTHGYLFFHVTLLVMLLVQ